MYKELIVSKWFTFWTKSKLTLDEPTEIVVIFIDEYRNVVSYSKF